MGLTTLGGPNTSGFERRVAIFGATGGTGIQLTRLALAAGLHVRLLVRDPKRMPLVNERIRYVVGNVLDRESVRKTILGSDAVFSCLGRHTLRNPRICGPGIKIVLDVMKQHGVKRLIVESSHGVGDSNARGTTAMRLLMWNLILRAQFADKIEMEAAVAGSATEWTLVRPVTLTNGPQTSRYRISTSLVASLGSKISRADVAEFMLKCYTEQTWIRQTPSIAY